MDYFIRFIMDDSSMHIRLSASCIHVFELVFFYNWTLFVSQASSYLNGCHDSFDQNCLYIWIYWLELAKIRVGKKLSIGSLSLDALLVSQASSDAVTASIDAYSIKTVFIYTSIWIIKRLGTIKHASDSSRFDHPSHFPHLGIQQQFGNLPLSLRDETYACRWSGNFQKSRSH